MCGIAGYSVANRSGVDRTLAVQALLAGIAERGADAVGYAYGDGSGETIVRKKRAGASAVLDDVVVPRTTEHVLVHVRDYTKGHPRIEANNHPIRHGTVVGIHNGIIENDEEIFARPGFTRAEPAMTVDSEAIFALLHRSPGDLAVLEELRGAMATAWLDERDPETLHLARGVGRPLWLGLGRREFFFASTRSALELVERTLRIPLRLSEVREGRALAVVRGRCTTRASFVPDHGYEEENVLPTVRAPQERVSCLERLAAIAAAA
jgi:glucosamine 6-phosphate synthetase-like amidotransferase/phosphosugar isomerase protein